MVNKDQIDIAKEIYSQLPKWNLANQTISGYFNTNPLNNSKEVILLKVILIDSLYKTNLKDQIAVAEHIATVRDLDRLLKEGSPKAVDLISNCIGRNLLSFASKFCHFHNKTKYPIYDKYVCIALKKLVGWKDTRTFQNFLDGIKTFRETNSLLDIDYEDLDKYLWLYGLVDRLNLGKKDINKEIHQLYMDNKTKFEGLTK